MDLILEATDLNKKVAVGQEYELSILRGVDLSVEAGEFISVMGASGSGKSTLLYNVSGMDRLTSGSVKLQGREISGLKEEELARIRLADMGFIFQEVNLLKDLTLIDNVMFPALVLDKSDKLSIRQRAEELMERTGIRPLADHGISQASGGQLQRVGICRALINGPEILFGDEPTGALDSRASQEIMAILADINQTGTTVVLVTHDTAVAAKTQRILYMKDGEIISEKKLSKYDPACDDIRVREEGVMKWLVEQEM